MQIMNNIPFKAQKWHLEFVRYSIAIPFGATSAAEIASDSMQVRCKM